MPYEFERTQRIAILGGGPGGYEAALTGAQLGADALADREARCVMDGVLGEVELTALPFRTAQNGPARGPQPGMVVGDHVFDPAQTAGLEALQKGPPMDLCLGQGDRDPENPAALVGADADR